MKALVTGATGFVGSAVARRLIANGIAVRALARPTSDRRNLAGLDCEIATGDLNDEASMRTALAGCDALFHVAADYRLWVPKPAEIYRTNVEATERLMRAARASGIGRVVYTSSVATLGLNPDASPADEATPSSLDGMIGHYKRSKFLAEEAVKALVRDIGLDVVIVNPSAPVGPRDLRPTPTGKMIVDAARGKMPVYVDTGLNLVHVDDVAEGHLLAYRRGRTGERYILGGENMSLREILGEIAILVGRKPPSVRLPHGLILPIAYVAEAVARLTGAEPTVTVDGVRLAQKHMYFTSAKAERELGYRFRPARAAIADAVAWFKANGALKRGRPAS
jgi:dihydroflavonol-4-reductase